MQMDSNIKTVHTVCGICTASCGMLLHFQDNELLSVEGNKQHPVSKGFLCSKGKALLEMINSPERIRFPLKKTAQLDWQRISWPEALQLIVEKLSLLKEAGDPQALAIHIGQAGINKQFPAYAEHFARMYGTPNYSTAGSHCHLSRAMASHYTFGCHPQPDFSNSKCIVLWGSNPEISNPPSLALIKEARQHGGKLIVIDPRRTRMAREADLHLQVLPGMDGALALAFIKVILEYKLYDVEFVKNWTTGFDQLQQRLSEFQLEDLAGLTDLAADKIEAAARLYATTSPACIANGNAMELHLDGFQAARSISILQAITGNLDIKGGELFIPPLLPPLNIKQNKSDILAIGQEAYPLFYSFTGHAQANKYADAILHSEPYKLRSMIIVGSNPLLTWPDAGQLRQALSQLDFLVVMEQFMTETAQLADLILPAASFLGSYELWENVVSDGSLIAGLSLPLIDEKECRSNWWLWQTLTKIISSNPYPWCNEAEALNIRLQQQDLHWEELAQYPNGYVYGHWESRKYLHQGFATPSGKVELFNRQLEQAEFGISRSAIAPSTHDYPFILSSGARTAGYMHSRFRNIASLRKLHPEPRVELNSNKADELGVEEGDMVRLESRQGQIKIKVKLNPDLHPKVLLMPHGWDEANANILSASDQLDPISGFPADRSIMVRINKTL